MHVDRMVDGLFSRGRPNTRGFGGFRVTSTILAAPTERCGEGSEACVTTFVVYAGPKQEFLGLLPNRSGSGGWHYKADVPGNRINSFQGCFGAFI